MFSSNATIYCDLGDYTIFHLFGGLLRFKGTWSCREFSGKRVDPRGLIRFMLSWSDAYDCTTAVLEDLFGLVFYFLCARSLRFFSGSRSCLVEFLGVGWSP